MKRKKQLSVEKPDIALKPIILFSIAIFLLIFSYAILRYNIFKGVALSDIPLYISNKAIAVTAISLLGSAGILGPLARIWPERFAAKLYARKYLGLFGFGLAVIHTIITLVLFSPSYYPKFFAESRKLTLNGELSLLFGVLAFIVFLILTVLHRAPAEKILGEKQMRVIQKLIMPAFLLVLLHVFFMGFESWLKPADWPGGLVPVTLISSAILVIIISIRLFDAPKQKNS